jgi:hypothetical protein
MSSTKSKTDHLACPSCGASDGRFLQWQCGSFAWGCVVSADGDYDMERSPVEYGDDIGGIEEWECVHCHETFGDRQLRPR